MQNQLAAWNRRGEWFERAPILKEVARAGGWERFFRENLPDAEWIITIHHG